MHYHCLFGNVLRPIICFVEIKISYEKCDTFKILGIVTVNLQLQQKHFVDLGLTGSVPGTNYSFELLVSETHYLITH